MEKHTGGPAFPGIEFFDEKPIGCYDGMTLRDYFAGQVISALYAARFAQQTQVEIAKRAYLIADAMLEVRK